MNKHTAAFQLIVGLILNLRFHHLPSFFLEETMRLRPKGWPLPRPKAIHHTIEDFLAEWDAPISHIQPLRRFLEHCVQTDLRAFYAGKVVPRSCPDLGPVKYIQLKKVYVLTGAPIQQQKQCENDETDRKVECFYFQAT